VAFVVSLLFQVLVLLMFNYLFGGALEVPGGGDYVDSSCRVSW
jgi:ABC-2 type transport system permease protein